MADSFAAHVARTLAALQPPAAVLVAASAGADSTALAAALAEVKNRHQFKSLRIVLGHVRHDLRPAEETAADWALVQALASSLGLEADVRQVEVHGRGGLEEAARRARYAALAALAEAHGCGAILTGHTATDQAETLLLRLVRGSGARGLSAMAPERALGRVRLLRPMLALTREEARGYCARRGLAWRDDPTNVDPRPRVRLRTEVLPVLEELGPGAVRRLAQAAARLGGDDRLLETLAARRMAGRDSAQTFARLAQPLRRRALAQWCERQLGSRRRVSAAHLEALERLVIERRGEVELPASNTVRRTAKVDGEGRLVLAQSARPNRAGALRRQTSRGGAPGGSGVSE